MKEKMMLLQTFVIILFKITYLKAQCNTCSTLNQMACLTDTTYQFCANGVPTGSVGTCPTGYVCSTTNSPIICQSSAAGAVPTCNNCNTCDANSVFACTGINTYALCLGQTTPSTSTGTCGADRVCDITSTQICASSATATPTCPASITTSTTTTTTTTTPTIPTTVPTYAQYYCSVMRMNRRFQVPAEFDTSCRRYIYCFLTTAGTWSGQIYTCAGSTFFDPVSLYCVATRPTNC